MYCSSEGEVHENPLCGCVFVSSSSTLPSADYPMLVLTGPQGCGKRELAHRLCHEFSDYFAYGSVLQLQYITWTVAAYLLYVYLKYMYMKESEPGI